MRARARSTLALLLAGALLSRGADAQETARPAPELRADLLVTRGVAVHAGAGVQVPAGVYARIGAVAAAGVRASQGTGLQPDGRVDLLGRFLLDPFRQSPWGFSAGAGLSARFEHGQRVTPLLLVALEVEGRRRTNGWVPAVQVGLGGGARVGVVLRRSAQGAR